MKQDNEHRPAYLRLYERLRGEIVRGDYPFGARMPSKRQLAEEEGLSVVTVEHAYALLTDEGYLEARRRSGHYVQFHDTDGFVPSAPVRPAAVPAGERADFPFSVLSRVMRRVISEYGEQLLEKSPNNGCDALRQAISRYLARSRGIRVKPEQIFVGSGAGLPMFMHIPGENLCGVYSANEFLTRINLMKAYKDGSDTPIMPLQGKKVAVVGGGNVAMDAARCSKRLGADVYVVYRRGMEELPARHEEVEHAIEEGIVFKTLNNPVKINGDEKGYVSSMTCVEMELGEPDASGRRRPIEKVGSEHDLPVDCVIMSLGTTPNPLIKNTTPGLEVNRKGGIVVNEAGLTSHQNVYAGGDAVTGAATVILAMGAGKLGAKSIDEALSK